jgi:YD repeat-containing protein
VTKLEYGLSDPLRITALVDPYGRRAKISYDHRGRLVQIVDAAGLVSQVEYEAVSAPEPPTYTKPPTFFSTLPSGSGSSSGGSSGTSNSGVSGGVSWSGLGKGAKVAEKAIMIYGSAGSGSSSGASSSGGGMAIISPPSSQSESYLTFVTQLKTPYGTTRFARSTSGTGANTIRGLDITDALGHKSRLISRHNAPGVPASDAHADVPVGLSVTNGNLNLRNTYYWNARALAEAPDDYTKAEIWHWTHLRGDSSTKAGTLESIKRPLESRVWFNLSGPKRGDVLGHVRKTLGHRPRAARWHNPAHENGIQRARSSYPAHRSRRTRNALHLR